MPTPEVTLKADEAAKRSLLKAEKPRVYEKIMQFDARVERGESIAILQFQYDYACNFRCQHCDITTLRDKKRRAFTVDDVKELSRQADAMGLAHLVITGGEPLIFRELDGIVKAVDPQKFYITSDTNGWFLDDEKARHLKSIGVDKIQLSIDSLNAQEHDDFRRAPGSHARCLQAISAAQNAGLNIIVQTVVTKQRVRSREFVDFLEFLNGKGVGVFVTYAKPVGEWEGKYDVLIDRADMDYVRELEKSHNVFTHLTPAYGLDLGCIAVKRMVSITKYGDVMPCPYIHVSLGNFFEEPLKDILARAMKIRFFGRHVDTCLIAEDRTFLDEYEAKRIRGKRLPVFYGEVFGEEDFVGETDE
jgi:MoaA/NifB/PqqE/SkfB family radical SAM enzyme